jgi:hypothetical protein
MRTWQDYCVARELRQAVEADDWNRFLAAIEAVDKLPIAWSCSVNRPVRLAPR